MQEELCLYVVITTFHPLIGGAETQTLAQCQQLQERGYRVQIVTFRHDQTWLPTEVIEGVPVMRVAGLFLSRRDHLPRLLQKFLYLIALLAMGWTLWKRRKAYDILQICQLSVLCIPAAMVCRLARKPLAIVLSNSGSGDPHTKAKGPATLLAGPLNPSLPWLKVDGPTWVDGDIYSLMAHGKPFACILRSLLTNMNTTLVVLSEWMLRELKEYDFYLPGTQIIPNGVDVVRFHPDPVDVTSEEQIRTVVCVSRFRYEKGTDVLLQAWRLVQMQMPEARLVLVGTGPLEQQQKRLAEALNISQSIEFTGLRSDVPDQLHRGRIAVLPSRWEGMPNALLESMACGCACVATRVSGSEELIQHGISGLLVTPADYVGMAEAILTLLHAPLLVKEYGEAARATIEQHYRLEHILDSYIDVYRRLIDQKTSKS